MAFFKHRSQDRQNHRPGAAAQNEFSGASQQGTSQQYEDSASTPQGSTANPQYERPGPSQQDERSGSAPQHERPRTAYQATGSPPGAPDATRGLPGGWLGEIVLGLATLVIGLIVAAHPMHSLQVLAILLGVLMVVSGVYHVVRSLRRTGDHRMWGGIAGVLFFLVGIFLLRHTGLTLALIALFAGFAFVIAGIASLAEAASGHSSLGRGWSALFGLICLFAGIASIVTPIGSLARLAIVLGWAFAAMGIMHILGGIVSRLTNREEPRREPISVPGQRATEPTNVEGAYGATTEAHVAASAAPRHRRSRL